MQWNYLMQALSALKDDDLFSSSISDSDRPLSLVERTILTPIQGGALLKKTEAIIAVEHNNDLPQYQLGTPWRLLHADKVDDVSLFHCKMEE